MLVVLILLVAVSSVVSAQRLPTWELGAATGYASIPYYRGSASNRDVILPMPLAIYRGKNARLGEEGAHRRLFSSDKAKLELSLAGGLPVPAGASDARRGMPRLNTTLEFGPRLAISLWKKRRQSLLLHLPLRAVSSVSIRQIDMHGWVFAPFLHYLIKKPGKNGWQFNLAVGPQYGAQSFHAYYYDVTAEYSQNGRPSYEASAGYSGSRVTTYFQKRFDRLWMSAFARYDDLSGASFIGSPLVEKDHSLMSGFVVGWIFAKSPHRVYVPD
ncbi:MAG: MipA/OmpV family protein [Gammaproteobacteria bacterium]|nr:MipA/OmpV family protein [Gammaproteobacteria bacterium]